MTATSELHSTAIPVTQHPMESSCGTKQKKLEVESCKGTKIIDLPETYTTIPEVIVNGRVPISIENVLSIPEEGIPFRIDRYNIQKEVEKENRWISEVNTRSKHE